MTARGAPTFSVVIPCYNSAAFIAETIASLAAQTYKDFEIVLVDDGSTDQSLAVAREAVARAGLDAVITARPPDYPKGVAGSRNAALSLARGEWIAFLDSDDLFAPHKLERVAATIAGASASNVRLLTHPSARFLEPTMEPAGETGKLEPGGPRWLLDRLLTEGNWFATCGMVVERTLLHSVGGFDTRLHGVEDWWLAIQLSAKSPWGYIDEPLASIRLRPQSLMQGRAFSSYATQFALLLRTARLSDVLSRKQTQQLARYIRTGAGRHYAAQAASRGEWSEVLRGCWEFVRAGFPGVGMPILGLLLWRYAVGTALGARPSPLTRASRAVESTHTN
jgi:glycosyltransferase involved in cell wall biosynthesis